MSALSSSSLNSYRLWFENSLSRHLDLFDVNTPLRQACEYALTTGGKRYRPVIVQMMARALGKRVDVSFAAMCVEFFHTASLVVDDLPSMDDDDERREKPSVHKVFGESGALLVSYALIAAGYQCLAENRKEPSFQKEICASELDRRVVLALESASFNTGVFGATGGQFLDLSPPNKELATIREIIHKKTTSLFEVAFVLGWLYGGGAIDSLEKVKKAAYHFGQAFQVADDLEDMEQDEKRGGGVNVACLFGKEVAEKMFHEEQNLYLLEIKGLGFNLKEIDEFSSLLVLR